MRCGTVRLEYTVKISCFSGWKPDGWSVYRTSVRSDSAAESLGSVLNRRLRVRKRVHLGTVGR